MIHHSKWIALFCALFSTVLIAIVPVRAQADAISNATTQTLSALWGRPSYSQLLFLPVGQHFGSNDDVNNQQWLIALNVHGYIGGTFINSNFRRIMFFGFERQVYASGNFSLDYLLGIMEGYRGVGLGRLPPVLRHDPGPLLAFTGSWAFSEHFTLNLATYGLGVLAGMSYLI